MRGGQTVHNRTLQVGQDLPPLRTCAARPYRCGVEVPGLTRGRHPGGGCYPRPLEADVCANPCKTLYTFFSVCIGFCVHGRYAYLHISSCCTAARRQSTSACITGKHSHFVAVANKPLSKVGDETFGYKLRTNSLIPFSNFQTIHQAPCVCFEAQTGKHLLGLRLTAFDP